MYFLTLKKELTASHFLVGADFGIENQVHPHHYMVCAKVEGENLDEHGYLYDINELDNHLERIVAKYRSRVLNEMDEFSKINPSLENFCRILWREVSQQIFSPRLKRLTIEIAEDEKSSASFDHEF